MTTAIILAQQPQHATRIEKYYHWFRVSLYTILLIVAQCSATLLGRLYFDKGGKSIFVAASVQSAGFPILLPLIIYSSKRARLTKEPNNDSSKTKPKLSIRISMYLAFGLMLGAMDLMYATGLSYLPLSTFALISATQLAFNAIFTFFLNSQKFTALILNSVVVLTMSAILIAINTESENTKNNVPKEKKITGFFCTLAASAAFSLHHSLLQLCYDKVLKIETFSAVLSMNFYPMLVSTVCGFVGLFASGNWKTMEMEMQEFEYGRVSYVMTLVWTAVTWQLAFVGMLGLIFEVSSLFSVVIGNLELTITPILAVMVFGDKIYGVKVIAFLLALWGFLSYIYQYYLDDQKAKKDKSDGIGEEQP